MEIYVPEAVFQDIIAISKSFNVDAQIVGEGEAADTKNDNQQRMDLSNINIM
jgi:phosphoribosylformylglycinamidine cyclo-ligase